MQGAPRQLSLLATLVRALLDPTIPTSFYTCDYTSYDCHDCGD